MLLTLSIETIEALLLISAVVAMIARRLRVPYAVGLLLAGIGLTLFHIAPGIVLTKELIFDTLLPPLIFEAAFCIHWKELRADLSVIVALASAGVVISAAITALGMNLLVSWPSSSALVFGVMVAATDPVSVIATFKDASVVGRLRLLVEAESLFNDGAAAVGFGIAASLATGYGLTPMDAIFTLLLTVGGGILFGAALAAVLLLIAGRTDDHLLEITFTTVGAYGSFLLAERFHVSGVLATLTAGLIIGNVGSLGAVSDKGRESVMAFWEYAAFVANSLIFLLIGVHEASRNFAAVWAPILAATALLVIGRAGAVYPVCFLFRNSPRRVSMSHQHILVWGGLRGALALALALGLPPGLALREEITTVTFAVVAFSLFVQGLTMTPLLRRLNELPEPKV